MRYSIDLNCREAAYLQLYHQLRNQIVSGIYPHGAKLPSKRLLAEEAGVSVITVEHAYSILCEEGYLTSRERSGYFVIYREGDFLSTPAHTRALRGSAESRSASPSVFPFSVFAKTVRKVLSDYGERLLIKSPNFGCPELREELSSYLARSLGISARPEQIVIGAGAEYLYSLLVQLLGKDRVFGLEDPSYEQIQRVYRAHGVSLEMLRLSRDGIESNALNRTRATVLHVTPFHSYPSGVTATASKKQEYLRWAQQTGGLIIEDNYDSELTVSKKNEDPLFSLSPHGSVIYLNTFSKTVAPSIRIGYMVLPPELLPTLEERIGFYSCAVPVLEQYVLAELLQSGDFERHVNRIRRRRRNEKK